MADDAVCTRRSTILISRRIKGIKFGTRTPINYFDLFYNSELFLRAHGTYSIKITDPLKFLCGGYSEKSGSGGD